MTQNLAYAGKYFMQSYMNTFSGIVEWSSANVSLMSFSWQHYSSSLHLTAFLSTCYYIRKGNEDFFLFFNFFSSSISLDLMNLEPLF